MLNRIAVIGSSYFTYSETTVRFGEVRLRSEP